MRRAWVAVAAAVVLLGLVTWGVGSWGDAPALGAKLSPLLGAQPADERWAGEAVEVLSAGRYRYVKLACDDGHTRWIATDRQGLKAGQRASAQVYAARDGFESRRLGRRFERLYFGAVKAQPPS
jgi:hypothetical protein